MQQGAAHINLADEELLNMHRNSGNNKWLGVLLQRYTVLLLGVAFKYLKDKEQAADAVQQVHLKALTSLPAGEISNFKGWLYILMRNHCFQQLRDKRHLQSDEVLNYVPAQDSPDVQTLQQQEQAIEQMKDALHLLDEHQQVCIRMFYLEKMTYQQIMEQKGYSFMQVKSYIQNGKRKLKNILTRNGSDE